MLWCAMCTNCFPNSSVPKKRGCNSFPNRQNDTKQEKHLQLHRIKKKMLFILLEIFLEITVELIQSVLNSSGSCPKGFEAGLTLPRMPAFVILRLPSHHGSWLCSLGGVLS